MAQMRFSWPKLSGTHFLMGLVLGAPLLVRAWFPVYNLRFEASEGYSRSVSLAVLSQGHSWTPDPSVPLLLPIQHLASLSAPRAVAYSEPLFAVVAVGAVGLAVYQFGQRSFPAVISMGWAALVAMAPLEGLGGPVRGELGAAYLLLGCGLWRHSKADALLAAAMGIAMGLPGIGLVQALFPYLACVGMGVSAAYLLRQRDSLAKAWTAVGLAVAVLTICAGRLSESSPDGPIQYEEAARIADQLATELPRNSWTLVSPTDELPYIYGRGWHVELADFVASSNLKEARNPSYRIPLPVKDVYFLVETTPLVHARGRDGIRPTLAVQTAPTPEAAYSQALGRASYEFQIAEWLSAYQKGHSDLDVVYRGENIVVVRAPGSLAE
jgi:hypothetical protein